MIKKINLQFFGEGEASADATVTEAAAPEGEKEQGEPAARSFSDLIKGEYKEDFQRETDRIISKRFGKYKQMESESKAFAPAMRTLQQRYGTDNIEDLVKAINDDDMLIEEKAMELGLTNKQYREMSRINYENEQFKAQQEQQKREAEAQHIYDEWQAQAEQVKAQFPDFDLNECLQNESFARLLRAGTDIRSAYIATNADGILQNAMTYTAQTVAKKTADTIQQNGNRPRESVLNSQAASHARTDVKSLDNAAIADLVRRASKGEVIRFSG